MPSSKPPLFGVDSNKDIAKAILELETAEAELITATQRAKDAKQQLGEVIRSAIERTSSAVDHTQLLRTLYWEMPNVNTTVLMDAFGLKIHELTKAAGSWVSDFACPACGTAIIVSSRTELKETQSRWRKYLKQSDRHSWAVISVLCDPCREEYHQRSRQENAAIHKARLERLNELHNMPYRQYLQTPEWQETRRAALRRAGFRCELCNADGMLNVHHRTYERRGYEDRRDLIVLCASCHEHFHDRLQVVT